MSHILQDLKQFLDSSPSPWHAAAEIGNRLASQDFSPLEEGEKWELEPGKSYFVIRGGALCAFRVPTKAPERALILASHTDSPALKVKPKPEFTKEGMTLLGVEVYGAPILSSWLNRDLGIAGRVVIANSQQMIEEKLIFIDDAPLMIPQIALHLEREMNEKGFILNKQEHLAPLASLHASEPDKRYLETQIRRHLPFHTLISFDLFLVPLEESRFLGMQSEMLASWRIDNLVSAHACVTAIARSQQSRAGTMPLALFWDHEEIGSRTAEGAASPFLSDVLRRISLSLKMKEEEFLMMKSRSLAVSIDMCQGAHPHYAAKFDPQHQALLGKGVALKYNADQRYATNASTAAMIQVCAHQLNLSLQSFVNRSDIASGSTVGPVIAQSLGIPTVDIGCPQLSMHSIRELIACQDYLDMNQLLTHLLQEY